MSSGGQDLFRLRYECVQILFFRSGSNFPNCTGGCTVPERCYQEASVTSINGLGARSFGTLESLNVLSERA